MATSVGTIEGAAPWDAPGRDPRPVHILVVVNGPGEVAAWLFPFAAAMQELAPDARLSVALLPCVFASGAEASVIEGMPGVARVLTAAETMRWLSRGQAPADMAPPDVMLHLGGEVLLSALLARRLGVPLTSYSEEGIAWPSLLHTAFVRDARSGGGAPNARVVGNLMVDAARQRVGVTRPREGRVIALLPGSRPYFVHHMLPPLLRAACQVQQRHPDLRFVVAKSDFISTDVMAAAIAPGADSLIPGDRGVLEYARGAWTIRTTTGLRVPILSPAEAMAQAVAAVTIPGTNTAELSALGIPMLTVLPTYRLRSLPMPGLAGHLGRIPLLGPLVKELVGRGIVRWRGAWAHPNRLAGRRVVPELVGRVSADAIAHELESLLEGDLAGTSQVLRAVMGEPGAARRLAQGLLAVVA